MLVLRLDHLSIEGSGSRGPTKVIGGASFELGPLTSPDLSATPRRVGQPSVLLIGIPLAADAQ